MTDRHRFNGDIFCIWCGLYEEHPVHVVQTIAVGPVRVVGPCATCQCELEGKTPMWSVECGAFVCRVCGECERSESIAA